MLTTDQLAEWERLASAATEGPWIWKRCDQNLDPEGFDQDPIALYSETKEYFVLAPEIRLLDGRMYIRIGSHSGSNCIAADYDLIAAARTAVPLLCEEVRRLQSALDMIRGRIKD